MARSGLDAEGTLTQGILDDGSSTPRLIVLCDDQFASYDLTQCGQLTIGRTKDCEIRIDHRSVSRRHAVLHVGDELAVEDLGSSNGTRLSGRRLPAHRPEPLGSGALVEIGVATLVVRGADRWMAAAPRAASMKLSTADETIPPPSAADERASTMARLQRLVTLVAQGRIDVVLLGETGVGKEVMADAIHSQSPRRLKPMVRLNCASLPESLLESELFGHERGAFSGATHAKAGLIESADGGTVLLDEVGELALPTQAKLLRVLESREVMRLGALRPRVIDVRFIAATNRDLVGLVGSGAFRRDLYHRLNGMTLYIPPLRERRDEIEPLARLFVAEYSARAGHRPPRIEPSAMGWLVRQPWPGNIRELRKVVERAVMLSGALGPEAQNATITTEHLAEPASAPWSDLPVPSDLKGELASLERTRIEEALARAGGNQKKAAELLGISRRTLIGRLDAYGLPRPRKSVPR